MILILSSIHDPHAAAVHARLERRGAAVTWFDLGDIPARARVAIRLGTDGSLRRTIERDEGPQLDLDAVTAVWHRRPQPHVAHASVVDPVLRAYVADECAEFALHVIDTLACLQVPAAKPVFRRAENKISQLVQAAAVGLAVPDTVIGNSPSAFLQLHQRLEGRLVSKMPGGTLSRTFARTEFFRFTERVGSHDVRHAHAVRLSPVIFQGYVDKALELRVTVVGDRVFAAEIHSQSTRQTQHDWRHYDHLNTPMARHELPEPVAEQCRALVGRLGLHYGAIDLVLTPRGEYVFLEINPNGQYLWIEDETGLPISDAICELLVTGRAPAPAA